jgi:hypothetical protein
MATVRGTVFDGYAVVEGAVIRLLRGDGTAQPASTLQGHLSDFEFQDVSPGQYILSVATPGFAEIVKGVHVEKDASVNLGGVELSIREEAGAGSPRVLTVCDALKARKAINYRPAIIVGVFKSGMDETLRLDCPTQLVTGEVGWPSSIGLTRPSQPPDLLRDKVEQKRQEILKSGPPGAHPRPERVVGLYGIFVAPSGLAEARCCRAAIETVIPPARLFGVGEKDLRVIR